MFLLDDGALGLAASDLTNHLACAHLVEQRRAIKRNERRKPREWKAAHADLLREMGDVFEQDVLRRLTAELGGCAEVAERTPNGEHAFRAAAADTFAAMDACAPLIYQGVFRSGRWLGKVDFLRRIPMDGTVFDGWGYEVLEAKLARQVKPHVVHQLALYDRLLSEEQGFSRGTAYVILGDGTEVPVDLDRYAALHRYLCRRVEATVDAGAVETYPEPVAFCQICSLQGECAARLRADDHLSFVAGARRAQRRKLIDAGVPTLSALAHSPEDSDVADLGPDAYELVRHQALLQLETRETKELRRRHLTPAAARGYARLPPPNAGDVFFDLEGNPYVGTEGGVEFLWGWVTAEGGYDCVWAQDAEQERDALQTFVSWATERRKRFPQMRIYHYAPHEKSKLESLALKYGVCETEVDLLLGNGVLVDLYAVVRQALQVGEESYGLKALEPHYGFVRKELSVKEGGGAILMHEAWRKCRDPLVLEAIRAYNEDDCVSTRALRDWLWGSMRSEAAQEFAVDFDRLAEPEKEKEYAPPQWLAPLQARIDALRSALPADPAGDTDEQRERRLLAGLLLYHYRESKPEWWSFFARTRMTPVELIEEREAVGGLAPVGEAVPAPKPARSNDWTFHFPPQELKLKVGTLVDPVSRTGHNVVTIGEDHLVIRAGTAKGRPEVAALIAGSPIEATVLRKRLEAVEQDREAHPVARALMQRTVPRLSDGASLPTAEVDVEEMAALVARLGPEPLVVQGPPGTGKTFRGAQMIVAAMHAGLRVAITANSHAAITNLLRAVERHAFAKEYAFTGCYRGSSYKSPHGFITEEDNDGCARGWQLVAGTSWLLVRDLPRFDVVFVDEAGQFALANAVAVAANTDRMVLLGDPQQLPQVSKAEHPDGCGRSVLEHLLDGRHTVADRKGILLRETWRMHPDVCAFVSERYYEDKLRARTACATRRVTAATAISGTGLRLLAVGHEGRSQHSIEEAIAIAAACRTLLDEGTVCDDNGDTKRVRPEDLMVVAPYNMAVDLIARHVPAEMAHRVGTVDRFQGQEAAIVFYAMTCSSGEDVPRGLDFLFDPHRFNVAVSRAQCLSVLVASPRILDADCRSLKAMQLLDGVCRFAEMAIAAPAVALAS